MSDIKSIVHKPFFMFLLQSINDMMGPEMSKGILQRVGIDLAEAVIEKFGEDQLFVEKLEDLQTGDTNALTYLDDTLEIHEGKLFLLGKCPFIKVLADYLDVKGSIPPTLQLITDLYNNEGLGYAVSPYCIIHQEYRKTIANHIRVNGNPIEFHQLGCKSGSGKIVHADNHIDEAGLTKESVDEKLSNGACIYTFKE